MSATKTVNSQSYIVMPNASTQKQFFDFFYAQDAATKIALLFAGTIAAYSLLSSAFVISALGAYTGTRIALAQHSREAPLPRPTGEWVSKREV